MSLLDGVQVNTALLSILTDLTGKQVLVETTDGSQWVGLFACGNTDRGSDLSFGLSYVFKKTAENAKNILPRKDETKEKMLFNYADVISVSALLSEDKNAKAFATDRDYHDKANGQTGEELEEWICDEEGEEIEQLGQMPDARQRYQKNGGWSVDDMFNTNSQMGVQSTFIEDMSQYTTVGVEGSTDEDRLRAERIAREIEGNTRSTYYARLENDDDERDLDKITNEDDFDPQSKKGQRNAYNNNNRSVRGGAANINRRAEGLKGNDRRGSGQQARFNQQGGGNYNQQRNQYIPGQGKRNSGNDDFGGEWNAPKDSSNRKDIGTKMVYENTNFKGGKVLLEQKPNSARPFDNKSGTPEGRVKKLKEFGDNFSNTFQQSRNEKEMTPQSPSRPQTTAGSAWNKGPPSSLLNSQSQSVSSSSATPTHSSPTPVDHQPVEQEVVEEMSHMDVSGENSKDSGHHSAEDGKKSDESSDANTSQSSTGKKFSFNPNAPAFTPRQAPPTTPTQAVPPQHQVPVGVPMNAVPLQGGMPPPGMIVPNQVMWQPQGFTQVPAGYQMYVPPQQMMSGPVSMAAPQRGSGPAQGYSNQQNPRRNGPTQGTTTMMVTPNGQWTNQVVMPQVGYYQYQMPTTSGAQPQQFSGNPQLVAQGQQAIPAQMYQQQRYPGGPMGYMVPPGVQQQPRYPTPQQGSHGPEGNGQYQQGPPPSSANSTGPNSQPPTPGPQQPPPVASPAQPPPPHSAGGRGSPAPPPAQQFVQQGGPPSSQQHMMAQPHPAYYHQAPGNMYMYPQQPGMIMYTGAGSMPMSGHVHPDAQHAHMDGANMQHPQYTQEQYPGFVPAGGPGFYNQAQHPQQPMSRQNSIPQAVYNVGQGAPPGMQAQGAPAQQGQAPPVAASQQQ